MKVSVVSLGCPKNQVDSEVIMGSLGVSGYELTGFPGEADIIIINTCAFIEPARIEAFDVITNILKIKSKNSKLIVCGCLPQLMDDELLKRFPEIDAIVGAADFNKIPEIIERLSKKRISEIGVPEFIYNSASPRLVASPPSYAYLKIAEGCSNCCAYCRIPELRGRYRSRAIKDIVKEAENLLSLGYKELILIAQDTTNFGNDRGKLSLPELLKELVRLDKNYWIRLLYTHPAHFSDKLISVIESNPQICKYIDIPLQHTHSEILKRMERPGWKSTKVLIRKLQKSGIILRTTFLVGFPGETEEHFKKLMGDVEELEFDWAGAFSYSYEKSTRAGKLGDTVPAELKEERLIRLMGLQQKITRKKNLARVGKDFKALVDYKDNKKIVGHTEFQCPEIDGKSCFKGSLETGRFCSGRVTRVNGYDLEVKKISAS